MTTGKILYIVRHGKSSWEYENISDIDRPLNKRGIKDAYKMAKRINKKNIFPKLIMSSFANRAIHTATIFSRCLNYPLNELKIEESLYDSYEDELLKLINNADNSISSLMIIGHNPAFTDLANHFVKNTISNIPTSGIVELYFNTEDWENINRTNLEREFFDYPKKEKS